MGRGQACNLVRLYIHPNKTRASYPGQPEPGMCGTLRSFIDLSKAFDLCACVGVCGFCILCYCVRDRKPEKRERKRNRQMQT